MGSLGSSLPTYSSGRTKTPNTPAWQQLTSAHALCCAGVLAALQSLLTAFCMDDDSLLSALALLACLAAGPAANKLDLSSSPCRLLGTLVALLDHHSPAVAASAARCMKLLSSDLQPQVCERLLEKQRSNAPGAVVLAQLVKAAAAAAEHDSETPNVAAGAEAASALQNLAATVPEGLVARKGVMSALIAGMKSPAVQLVLPSSRAVAALAFSPAATQAVTKTKGSRIIPVLGELLGHADKDVVCAAVTALQGIAQHCSPSFKEYIAAAHAGSHGKSTVLATLVMMSSSGRGGGSGVEAGSGMASNAAQALAALLEGCPANVKLMCGQRGPVGMRVIDLLIHSLRAVPQSAGALGKGALAGPLESLSGMDAV